MPESLHILVIGDDDHDDVDRMAVRRAMKSAEMTMEVEEAPDGATAIELLKTRRFDCVLLDHHLPDRDGLGVLRDIRAAGVTTPIIMMTAQGNEERAVDMMKAGATDQLAKSCVSLDHLFQSIRGAVRVNAAENAARESEERCRVALAAADTRGAAGKRAESELARVTAESERRRRLYEAVMSGTPDLAYVFDLEHRFIYANAALLGMWGRSWEEAIGKNCIELGYEPWHAAMHDREIEQVVSTKQPIRGEVPFNGRQGRRIYDYIFIPVFGARGEVEAVAGTTRDVTERKQVEEVLRKAKEDAEAANKAKDQFLSVLSHELRTPLMPVLTTVQALEMEPGLSETVRSGLQIIRRNVEMEARLIDDLLDLTRVSKGKLQLNIETTDVYRALRTALEICRPDIQAKRLNVAMDLTDGICPVRADPARLQQVLWNLISNAVKFTPDGGAITFRCRRIEVDGGGGRMQLEVSDTGVGIEPPALSRIFDAFEQGGQSVARIFGGLGLGLAISKALVTLHGGTIAAHSAGKNTGATFTVELPMFHEAELGKPRCDPPPVVASAEPRDIRILLVDDHEDTNRAMQRLLQRLGYDVQTAHCVQAALSAADTDPPFDLLISDIGLPDGSGLELMEQLLKRRPIKGIALSGFGMEEDVKKSKQAGFYEHLTKPINFKRLKTAIKQLTAD